MGEDDIRELFRLVRGINDRFQDMIDELRKENRADLLRCQDAYCTPRHEALETAVENQGKSIADLVKKVYGASAVVAAAVIVAGIIAKVV